MSRKSGEMSPALGFFFKFIFPYIFIIIGGLIAYFGFKNLVNARDSLNWPSTAGRIVSSAVKREVSHGSHGSSTSYGADIVYSYNTDTGSYTGSRVAYGDYSSSNSRHAYSIMAKYPVGKDVRVYYKPGEPTESLLEPGMKGQALVLPAFGLVFLVIGCVVAVVVPRAMKKVAAV